MGAIDEKRPLGEITGEGPRPSDPEMFGLLSPIGGTDSQTVRSCSSYDGEEIVGEVGFTEMSNRRADDEVGIDIRHGHTFGRNPVP